MASFVLLCVLLGIGHVLRSRVRLLGKLYLPSCVIGGLVGLAAIQLIAAGSGCCETCASFNATGWVRRRRRGTKSRRC